MQYVQIMKELFNILAVDTPFGISIIGNKPTGAGVQITLMQSTTENRCNKTRVAKMNLFILLFLVSAAQGYNILCLLPYPGKSHHVVFEPLLEELANRGHNVTVVSFFPSSNPNPNRREVSLVGLAPLNVEVIDLSTIDIKQFFGLEKLFVDVPLIIELAQSNLRLCEKLLYSDAFTEFVEGKGDYDVILVEHFNSDCMLGLIYNYKLPSIGLMSSPFLPWTPSRLGAPDNPSFVPGMTLPMTDDMSFFERIENALILYFYKFWFEFAIRWEEQKILEKRLGRKLPVLTEVAKNTSVVLVNTHYTLNGVRVMPPSFVEIGGIHLHNKTTKALPETLEKWVSGAKDGFILFSFGSLIRGSTLSPKRLDAILKVFAGVSQRVVWKWEAEVVVNLPSNVLIMKWLPQYDLLQHPNCVALITHAGLLSLTEAVAAGVPTVAVSVLGDQFGNAAHAGAATGAPVLRLTDLDEVNLGAALQHVLTDRMRVRAKLLAAKWHDRPLPPMDTAVFYIEQTARYGGLEMSSHARRLNGLQLAMLDVIGFIITVLFLTIVFLKWICGQCTKLRRKEKRC